MPLKRLLPTIAVFSFLLGALAVALAAGPLWHIGNLAPAAAASTSTPAKPGAAKAQAACDAFLKDFAAQLGVPQDKVKTSLKVAIKDAIDRAVKNGDLTADQASKAKARIDAASGCESLPAFGKHFGGAHVGAFAGRRGGLDGILNAAASALGVTPAELRTAVMNGKTLHDVAGSKISKADFDTAFRAALTKEIQPQVDAGKITADMARVRADQAVAAADSLWDSSLKDAVGGFFGRHQGPGKVPPGVSSTIQ